MGLAPITNNQKYESSLQKVLENTFGVFWPLALAFILGIAVHKILHRFDQIEHITLPHSSNKSKKQNSIKKIDVLTIQNENEFNKSISIRNSSSTNFKGLFEYNCIQSNLNKFFDYSKTENLQNYILNESLFFLNFNIIFVNFKNIKKTIITIKTILLTLLFNS